MTNRLRLCAAASLACLALTAGASPGNATYTYDGLGRLKSVLYEDGSGQFYTYDSAGNRQTSVSGPQIVFNVSANAPSVNEAGTASFTVTKSSGAQTTSTVNYATADGSAHAGHNYTATSGTLTFTASQTSQTINVATLDDHSYDGPLAFSVNLSQPADAVVNTSGANETVNEIDPAPVFSIAAGTAAEGTPVSLTVTRSNATSLTQTVNYGTSNGSAIAGTDYTTTSGTLTFAPADTSHSFSVPTTSRSLFEGNRSFTATLSTPSNGATIGTASAAGNITDVNTPVSFAVNSPATVAAGSPVTFTISANGGPAGATFTVNYATAGGTAVSGTDYVAASGVLSFPVGTTSQTVTVNTLDARIESDTRSFTMNLSNASSGAPIGTASGSATIQETNVPAAPVLSPSVTNNSVNGNWSLSWTNPGGNPTSYQLWETNPANQQIEVYSGTALSASGSGLKNSQVYYFQVQACNANGCGAYSNTATVSICYGNNC